MNGSVVSLLDNNKHEKIREKVNELMKIFYDGEKLSDLEIDIERQYVAAKYEKHQNYKNRKSIRYKVRWTVSDLNRYQD